MTIISILLFSLGAIFIITTLVVGTTLALMIWMANGCERCNEEEDFYGADDWLEAAKLKSRIDNTKRNMYIDIKAKNCFPSEGLHIEGCKHEKNKCPYCKAKVKTYWHICRGKK